jgi:hypothetical protein
MAKILMKQTKPGSMDGVTTNLYTKGHEYKIDNNEINQTLANAFVEARWAKIIRERSAPVEVITPPETAVEVSAPEIKESEPKVESFKEDVKPEIKSTRVFELARELKTPWNNVCKVANKLGIKVKTAQSGLTKSEVKRIKKSYTR